MPDELKTEMRRAASAVYLATDAAVADDLSRILLAGADRIASLEAELYGLQRIAQLVYLELGDPYKRASLQNALNVLDPISGHVAQSPADALAGVKAEAAATALDKAHAMFDQRVFDGFRYVERDQRQVRDAIRDLAIAIRSEVK